MSTESFHSSLSHQSDNSRQPTDSAFDLNLKLPMNALRIQGGVDGWCPQQYRAHILEWLNGTDQRTQTAFFFYIGATTRYNNSFKVMRSIQGNIDLLGIRQEYEVVQERLQRRFHRMPINALRLATAFPDRVFAFHSMSCDKETMTTSLFKRAERFTMPAVLAYSQALQLDLDRQMQGYADQWNRHHWLSFIQSESELPNGPHFISKYFYLCRENNYAIYFPPGMFTAGAKAASVRLFTPPYSFEQLVAYQRLMEQYNSHRGRLDTEAVRNAFANIDSSRLTPLNTVVSTFEDERRDGKVPSIRSTSIEYREAKAALLRRTILRD